MAGETWEARLKGRGSGLGTLLTAYFNEDWDVISGERWQDVVADFVTHQPPAHPRSALAELTELLSDDLSERDLDRLLREGVGAHLERDRFGYHSWREWLQAVRDELTESG